jgi:hypothetical protein
LWSDRQAASEVVSDLLRIVPVPVIAGA